MTTPERGKQGSWIRLHLPALAARPGRRQWRRQAQAGEGWAAPYCFYVQGGFVSMARMCDALFFLVKSWLQPK